MATNSNGSEPAYTPEVIRILEKVGEALQSKTPKNALQLLAREDADWARNARAVCFLRSGEPSAALDVLRGLVVERHLALKREAPIRFKTNFAVALLLSGNIAGGISALDEIDDESDPTVQKLRAAIQRWKNSMTFWQRLNWRMGGDAAVPFTLDVPPGDL